MLIVFAGPTVTHAEGRRELDAEFRPPASEGDVYNAARRRPKAIGIIDGVFARVPAVRHKEILWALDQGIAVYGSASMGALRAAELHSFGMIGVGRIFEDLASGRLEDDDEVAIAHGDASTGYRPLSDAMVDIRTTLESARTAGVISPVDHDLLVSCAKSLHFPDRSYRRMLTDGGRAGISRAALASLADWLETGRVAQKRLDAIEMLHRMRAADRRGARSRPDWGFQHTIYWDRIVAEADARATRDDDASLAEVIDELRLLPGAWARVLDGSRLRHVLLREARRRGIRATARAERIEMAAAFRRAHRLDSTASLDAWLVQNGIDDRQLAALIDDETVVHLQRCLEDAGARAALVDHLRVTGQFSALHARAADKRRRLEQRGLVRPSWSDVGLSSSELVAWFFRRCNRPAPDHLERWASASGFADVGDFLCAVRREYVYASMENTP